MSRYSTAPRGGCACEEGGRNEAARAGRGGECHFLHADFLPAVAACARSFAARRSCRAVACAPSYRPPSKSGGGLRRGGRTRGRRRPFSPPRYCSVRPTVSRRRPHGPQHTLPPPSTPSPVSPFPTPLLRRIIIMAGRRVLVALAAAVAAVAAATATAAHDGPHPGRGEPYTSDFGTPVGDDRNTLSAGPRGPQLVQDTRAFEKLARFNRTSRCGGVGSRGEGGGGRYCVDVEARAPVGGQAAVAVEGGGNGVGDRLAMSGWPVLTRCCLFYGHCRWFSPSSAVRLSGWYPSPT